MVITKTIQNLIHVCGLDYGAIEVGCEPLDIPRDGKAANPEQSFKVPGRIVASQLYLQTFEPILTNPVSQRDGEAIAGLLASQVARLEWIQTTYQVPGTELPCWFSSQIVRGVAAAKGDRSRCVLCEEAG
jgi:hypothetical protein